MARRNGIGAGTRLRMKWSIWKMMARWRVRQLLGKNDRPPHIY